MLLVIPAFLFLVYLFAKYVYTEFKYKVLIIDDEQSRLDVLSKFVRGCGIQHIYTARNFSEVKQLCKLHKFRSMYFDNDLGAGEKDGKYVANWCITTKALYPGAIVYIHSMNPDAAKDIATMFFCANNALGTNYTPFLIPFSNFL
jgi:hypothetical protein